MANLLILPPMPYTALAVSRGSGAAYLATPDPKEVWVDSTVGSAATFDVDFGMAVAIDTVFLGYLFGADPAATWQITGGTGGYNETTIKATSALRVPEPAGRVSTYSHAFWHGDDVLVRYLRISVTQPAGAAPLSIGILMAGAAFVPGYNQEWGSGRTVRDTGSVTRLPSGGLAIVEGARYGSYKWSLGDLTDDEADWLYQLQLDRGETRRVLVVENPAQAATLRNAIHYGVLAALRPSERRNAVQTRWELQVDDWMGEADAVVTSRPTPAVTLGGVPVSFGGEILTIGV